MTTDTIFLFRVTWDERLPLSRVAHREQITDSLSNLQGLLVGLLSNRERYSNIKKYAAQVDWQEV